MTNSNIIVLAGLLQDKQLNSYFLSEGNWKIFSQEYLLFGKALTEWFSNHKEIITRSILNEKFGGTLNNTWDNIENFSKQNKINASDWKWHLLKLKEEFGKQSIGAFLQKINSATDIQKYLLELNTNINGVKDLFKEKTFVQKSLRDGFEDYDSKKQFKESNPDWNEGILTGYSFLDGPLAGIRKGELFAVGGPTGGGKSTFLMNLALQMWHQNNKMDEDCKNFFPGYNVLYFSLEMNYQDMWSRCLARLGMIEEKKIRDFRTSAEENIKIRKIKSNIAKYNSHFEIIDMPRGLTSSQLESMILDTKSRFTPDIIVVDYMGEMALEDTDEKDWLKQGIIAAQLHEIARAQNVVMLTAVQLNREQKQGKEEQSLSLDRISRSSVIAHNCNFVCLINQRKEENARPDFEIFLAKNRRGEQTKGVLNKYMKQCALLEYPNNSLTEDISEFIDVK